MQRLTQSNNNSLTDRPNIMKSTFFNRKVARRKASLQTARVLPLASAKEDIPDPQLPGQAQHYKGALSVHLITGLRKV